MSSDTTRTAGGILPFLLTVVLFGIGVPWWKGLDAYDPILLLISLAVPILFVTPIATEHGAHIPPLSRAFRALLYSALMTLTIAFHLVATVNVTHWFGHILLPQTTVFFSGILAVLIAEAALAIFAVWMDLATSPQRARTTVRLVFGALLLTYLYLFRFAPPSLRTRIDENLTSDGLTVLLLGLCAVLALAGAGFAILMQRSASRRSAL